MKKEINNELSRSIEKCFNHVFLQDITQNFKHKSLINIINTHKDEDSICTYPYGVFWKITSQCNLRCKHCFYYKDQEMFNSKNDFSTEELFKLAEFFVEELNVISFSITGGEPFLQKDILKILKYLKSKNVYIQIQTNATLITKEIATKLSEILNPKLDIIQVSLEGTTKLTHDKIRGEGNFKKTIRGIENLTKNNLNVVISYTATSENVSEIPDLYKLGKNLKVGQIIIGRFKACSEEQAYLKPNFDQVFVCLSKLMDEMGNDKSINLKLTLLKTFDFLNYEIGQKLLDEFLKANEVTPVKSLMCHKHEKVNVCADGKMYLCADTEQKELCLGNLKEQSFFKIWENRFSNVFFQERNLDKSACKKCNYIDLCTAGCPAKAYCEYGDINAPDGDCPYGKVLMVNCRKLGENYVK